MSQWRTTHHESSGTVLLQSSGTGLREGVTVAEVMDTWTMQMSYPVVTVRQDDNTITASQQRFLLNPRGKQKEEFTSPYGSVSLNLKTAHFERALVNIFMPCVILFLYNMF